MICKFDTDGCIQKELYFKMCNVISLATKNTTIAGIYAIYKNDICLYVSQSKNLLSRVSTHLPGKYKEADYIYLMDIKSLGFDDFNDRNDVSKKSILDNCEKYIMKLLKPIENIIADFSFDIPVEQRPDISGYLPFDYIIDSRDFAGTNMLTIQDDDYDAILYADWIRIAIHKGLDLDDIEKCFDFEFSKARKVAYEY